MNTKVNSNWKESNEELPTKAKNDLTVTEEEPYLVDKQLLKVLLSGYEYETFSQFKERLMHVIEDANDRKQLVEAMKAHMYMFEFFDVNEEKLKELGI